MPLPKVKPNENEQTYVSRCISYEKRQDTDMSDEQIKAACYERYRTSKKEDKADLHNITKEDIVNIGTKIAKEIIKRKEAGDMDYTVSEDKSKPYKEFWQAITDNLTTSQINILTQEENTKEKINKKENKKEPSAKYYSDTSPYYRFYEEELEGNIKSAGWDDKKLLVDVKSDGLRLTVGKVNGEAFFYVDPEDVKEKDPNVTERLPNLKKEVEEVIPDDTILDAEFIAIGEKDKELLHRSVANSILNSNIKGEKLEEYAAIFVFIPLFWNGEDLRDESLKNRLDYLDKIEETDNIFVERVSGDLSKEADAYIIDGGNISQIEKAFDKITNDKIGRPKYFAEGVMIKDLDHKYETPTHHGWSKMKNLQEIDLRILNKDPVKGSNGEVFNYDMGLDINKEYYEALISMGTQEWYENTGILTDDGKYYRGKESKDKEGQYIMEMGTSDNHKEETDVEIGDIYRIAVEEVLRYDNPKHPEYPRYSFYIGVPLEPIPERETTDDIEVVDKLAGFQPKRIPISELERLETEQKMGTTISSPEMLKPESIAGKPKEDGDKRVGELPRSEWESKSDLPEEIHIKGIDTVQEFLNILTQYAEISKEDVKKWVEDGKIPEDIYKKIAKEEKPLPDKLYPRDISGKHRAFAQCLGSMHTRIYTIEGWKSYHELELGDLVLTHKLRFKPIVRLNKFKYDNEWYRVTVEWKNGKRKTLRVTKEHPFLNQNREFTRANELELGDVLLSMSDSKCEWCGKSLPLYSSKWFQENMNSRFCSSSCAASKQHRESETTGGMFGDAYEKLGKIREEKIKDGTWGFQNNGPTDVYEAVCKANKALANQRISYPQKKFYELLDEMDIDYVPERKIQCGKHNYWADAAIEELNIDFEIDGERHHTKEKDNERDRNLLESGWKTIRIPAKYLTYRSKHYDIDLVKEIIINALKNDGHEFGYARVEVVDIEKFKYSEDKLNTCPRLKNAYNLEVKDDHSYVSEMFINHNCHVRGIEEEEFDKWDNGDLSISEMVKDHSLHMDLRLWFGDNKEETQQWVITESSMKSYIRGMKGEIDPDTGNSQKCLVITKPSSEEPKDVEAKADEEEALLDEEGAKIVEKYAIEGTETILPPGDVGASPYKYAILFTTWTGKVAFGAQRPDLSEFWLYPDDDIPEKNKKLLDGKYIVRGFAPGGDKRWWFFKAKDHPKPMDSIDHSATGDFYPVPADELKKMGSDEYKKQSKKAFKDALS